MRHDAPWTDYPVSRLLRVFFTVSLSLIAAAMTAGFLWSDPEWHYTHRAGGPLFLLLFLSPMFVGFILAMTAVFYAVDRWALRDGGLRPRSYFLILAIFAAGVPSGFVNFIPGMLCLFLVFYWVLTGRVAGRPGWSIANFRQTRWDEKIYLIAMVMLLAPALFSTVSRTVYATLPQQPGTPPFQAQYAHQMNGDLKRAMRRFPDAQSCLRQGATATQRQDLLLMDWDRIDTSGEAKVCMFRLLHGWGGVKDAATWLEAQGFRIGKSFSSETPYEARDGTLRVDGGWLIRQNGPRFPTTGVIRRSLRATPYGMSVQATFCPDGSELLYVDLSFSTL